MKIVINYSKLAQFLIEPHLGEINASRPHTRFVLDGVNNIIGYSTFNACALADLVIAELEGSSQ